MPRWQILQLTAVVEVYKDTLAPASLNSLVSMTSAILFAGAVGNLVDRTPRLKMVRCAVALQKVRRESFASVLTWQLLILTSFSIFLSTSRGPDLRSR